MGGDFHSAAEEVANVAVLLGGSCVELWTQKVLAALPILDTLNTVLLPHALKCNAWLADR